MNTFLRKHSHLLALLGVVVLTIPLLLPFFHTGFFTSHDGEWTVVRLADMYRTVRDGQIPARYSSFLNMRYGYPLFNFAYPAPYYLGLIFVLLKLGFVSSIKILFMLSTIASGIGMYLFSRKLWKSTLAGVVSAVLFLYLPYRMVDLYVRGSLGETFALAIVPFLFLCMYYTVTKRSLIFTVLTGGLLGLLIPSHNILSLLFAPVLLIFAVVLVYLYNKKAWREVVLSFVLGIGLSAFFLLPAIMEKQLILLARIPIADRSLYFVSLRQLILPSWGYGVPTDPTNPFTYQLGIAQLLGLLATVWGAVLVFRTHKKPAVEAKIAAAFLLMVIPLVFLLFSVSTLFWQMTPLLSEINYPWTMIAPLGFLVSVAVGFLARTKYAKLILPLLGILAIILVIFYARPETYVNRGDDYYVTNMATTTSSHEYTPLWVKDIPLKTYNEKVSSSGGSANISAITENSRKISFQIDATEPATFRINTIYYPGWKVMIDGKEAQIAYNNPQGVMEGTVSPGQHAVQAVFSETPLRMAANMTTIISFLVALVLLGIGLSHRRYEKK